MQNPDLIDPKVFAEEKQTLKGSFTLADLDERVSAHEYPANRESTVSFALQGGVDRLQRPYLDLTVKSDMPLLCQRCSGAVPFELDEHSRIVLFADEKSLDEAMLADDALEGMIAEKELDVRTLVEDQILMALPYSPRHEDCGGETAAAVEAINRDKPNPFAVLAGLKSSKD